MRGCLVRFVVLAEVFLECDHIAFEPVELATIRPATAPAFAPSFRRELVRGIDEFGAPDPDLSATALELVKGNFLGPGHKVVDQIDGQIDHSHAAIADHHDQTDESEQGDHVHEERDLNREEHASGGAVNARKRHGEVRAHKTGRERTRGNACRPCKTVEQPAHKSKDAQSAEGVAACRVGLLVDLVVLGLLALVEEQRERNHEQRHEEHERINDVEKKQHVERRARVSIRYV
eukprot:Amastigsp_a174428_585.p2 type:complete len:233 gc:universal Amastigsp_a174428_585:1044-1742(+)